MKNQSGSVFFKIGCSGSAEIVRVGCDQPGKLLTQGSSLQDQHAPGNFGHGPLPSSPQFPVNFGHGLVPGLPYSLSLDLLCLCFGSPILSQGFGFASSHIPEGLLFHLHLQRAHISSPSTPSMFCSKCSAMAWLSVKPCLNRKFELAKGLQNGINMFTRKLVELIQTCVIMDLFKAALFS